MLAIPPEIALIRNHQKRIAERNRFIWEWVRVTIGARNFCDLGERIGYRRNSISALQKRPTISIQTAIRLRHYCGKDKRGNWLAPLEVLAPEAFEIASNSAR